MRVRFLVFVLLLSFARFAHALETDLHITQYPHAVWTTAHGLSSDNVRAIAQTEDGYIWLATSHGLARFTGNYFDTYNSTNTEQLPAESFTALLKSADGTLWIGTEGSGLISYDGTTFRIYNTEDGLSDNTVLSLAQDGSGKLWILTPAALNTYANDKFSSVSVGQPVCLFADQAGAIVGTTDGFSIITNGRIVHYPEKPVTAVYRNRKGEIWLGIEGKGLCKFENGKVELLSQSEPIRSLLQDRDGNIWIGTSRGLSRFLKNMESYSRITAPVMMLFEDRQGSIWLATSGSGVHMFYPSAFAVYSAEEGMSTSRTWCVIQDHSGVAWIGTELGVSRLKDGVLTNFDINLPVKTITEDRGGTIWAGTSAGILRWNGSSFVMTLPGISATTMVTQKNGDLWIGSGEGLRRYANGRLQNIASDSITGLYVNRNDELWIGTFSGLKKWKNERIENTSIAGSITAMLEDKEGNAWLGSGSELSCICGGKRTALSLNNLRGNPNVSAIVQDQKGALWINTGQGIFQARLTNGKFASTQFGIDNGLQTLEAATGSPAAALKADGSVWFATVNGIARINPDHYFAEKHPAQVNIIHFEADRAPVRNFRDQRLRLPAGTTRVEIQYSAINFISHPRYRYVLQGFDEFWTNAGSRNHALYTNLPPGKYRFKVIAGNHDNLWNLNAASVSFEIPAGVFRFPSKNALLIAAAAIVGFIAGWFFKSRASRIPV